MHLNQVKLHDNFLKINNEIIVSVPKIIVVPILRKVEETIEGTIIRNENGLEIPPVK